MHFLEEKILADGVIKPGNILKVDNFLNHQIDIMRQIAHEFKRRFKGKLVTGILTIEASGIAIATMLLTGCIMENTVTGPQIEPRYVTFSAESEQTFSWNFQPDKDAEAFTLGEGEYFEYRVGNGDWNEFTSSIADVPFGGSLGDLQLRGISSRGSAYSSDEKFSIISFGGDARVSCSGDIRTIVNFEDYENANTSEARFKSLFYCCPQLISAPDFPATELATYCYCDLFCGCTSLETAPALPADVLADYCYLRMFLGCSSLKTAPELPAMNLATGCYGDMFMGCNALESAPVLPATQLHRECYGSIFGGCELINEAHIKAKTIVLLTDSGEGEPEFREFDINDRACRFEVTNALMYWLPSGGGTIYCSVAFAKLWFSEDFVRPEGNWKVVSRY